MRKRIIQTEESPQGLSKGAEESWLPLAAIAEVELTSEDPGFPFEAAVEGGDAGWRASAPGRQTIRLRFERPVRLRRIFLHFEEHRYEREQEFVLRWSSPGDATPREIVRQQFCFSPGGAEEEWENYEVSLENVALLELSIDPDRRWGAAHASLARLRLA